MEYYECQANADQYTCFSLGILSSLSSSAIPSIFDHVVFMLMRDEIAISGKLIFFSDLTPPVQLLGNEVPIIVVKGFHA